MDEQKMVEGEKKEDSGLQQIMQLCQSGDPAALQQIAQIVQGMLGSQEKEESEISGGGEGQGSHEAMVEAVKNQMGG